MNLYVIGNGFDRAHGLETSYYDFREYLEEKDLDFLTDLETMYNLNTESMCNLTPERKKKVLEEYLWKEFEKKLSAVSEDAIVEQALNMDLNLDAEEYGIEDTLNEYWEQQYGYIEKLNDFVKSWVEQIDIGVNRNTYKIKSDSNDLFLTFNYTLVLEEVYGIDERNILHIHGVIGEFPNCDPIIGHGESVKISEALIYANEAGEKLDEKKSSIYNALANYYKRTLKNVKEHLNLNQDFFERIKDVDKIFVIGHSFGDVDMPYFNAIKENIEAHTMWNIYYFCKEEEEIFKEQIISIGVKDENIQMFNTEEFYKKSNFKEQIKMNISW